MRLLAIWVSVAVMAAVTYGLQRLSEDDQFILGLFVLLMLSLAGFFSLCIAAITGRWPWEQDGD